MLLSPQDSLLLLIDLQARLFPAIAGASRVLDHTQRLLAAANHLAIPSILTEQYVKGLGPTLDALQNATVNTRKFEKIHFSAGREPHILAALKNSGRRQVVIAGTELHVCVLQTALSLLAEGFSVFLVADAAGSRTEANRQLGIERLRQAGVWVVSTEMVLFEWLERADTADFRALLPLIRD